MSLTAIQDRPNQASACPICVPSDDPDRDIRCADAACPSRRRGAGYLPDDSRTRGAGANDDDYPHRGPWALGDEAYRRAKGAEVRQRLMALARGVQA